MFCCDPTKDIGREYREHWYRKQMEEYHKKIMEEKMNRLNSLFSTSNNNKSIFESINTSLNPLKKFGPETPW